MQGNYVKLLNPQARDLGERDGRGSCLGSSSRKPHTDFHTMSGVLHPQEEGHSGQTGNAEIAAYSVATLPKVSEVPGWLSAAAP